MLRRRSAEAPALIVNAACLPDRLRLQPGLEQTYTIIPVARNPAHRALAARGGAGLTKLRQSRLIHVQL